VPPAPRRFTPQEEATRAQWGASYVSPLTDLDPRIADPERVRLGWRPGQVRIYTAEETLGELLHRTFRTLFGGIFK
jgi:hypothetical protein